MEEVSPGPQRHGRIIAHQIKTLDVLGGVFGLAIGARTAATAEMATAAINRYRIGVGSRAGIGSVCPSAALKEHEAQEAGIVGVIVTKSCRRVAHLARPAVESRSLELNCAHAPQGRQSAPVFSRFAAKTSSKSCSRIRAGRSGPKRTTARGRSPKALPSPAPILSPPRGANLPKRPTSPPPAPSSR